MDETIAAIWARVEEFDPGSDPELEKVFIEQQRAVFARLIDAYLDAGDEARAELVQRFLAKSGRSHFWRAYYNHPIACWRAFGMMAAAVSDVHGETLQAFFERLCTAEGIK